MIKTKNENCHARMDSRSMERILLIGIMIVSLIVIPVSAAKLATPTLLSPTNNQHFNHYPRYTTLVCKPVTGADRYEFFVEYKSGSAYWPWIDTTETVPYYTFQFIGEQPGRWRVIAHDSSGIYTSSTPSAWRTFDYSDNERGKLATPVLLSPVNNAIFYHFPRETTLTWKMVPGASGYHVEVEYFVQYDKSWYVWRDVDVSGVSSSYFNFHFISMQPGRWRIKALSSGFPFASSDFSAWRTFTYKI